MFLILKDNGVEAPQEFVDYIKNNVVDGFSRIYINTVDIGKKSVEVEVKNTFGVDLVENTVSIDESAINNPVITNWIGTF